MCRKEKEIEHMLLELPDSFEYLDLSDMISLIREMICLNREMIYLNREMISLNREIMLNGLEFSK